MQRAKCENCGRELPMNETFKVSNNTLCEACVDEILENQKDVAAEEIQPQVDPTICINCRKDNEDTALPTIAGLPTCEECEGFFRNRPFAPWVKASFAAVVAIVVFSLLWHWRFIEAYSDIKSSARAFSQRNYPEAAELMKSASKHVPESKFIRAMDSYFQAIILLEQNNPIEALALLRDCKDKVPAEINVDELIKVAETSIAFDNKDYDRFLYLSLARSEEHPDDAIHTAQVASAYSCKYAVTGEEDFKQQALNILDKAREMPNRSEFFEEYEDRILHRLHTREIIDRKQFKARFPNGWRQQGGQDQ